MQITPIDSLSEVASPPTAETAKVKHFIGLGLMRVRVKLTVGADGPVAVRPWYWADGEWWPLRADGAEDAGVKPVTAVAGSYDKKADGFFVTGGLANFVVLRTELGQASDIEKLYIDACDAPP